MKQLVAILGHGMARLAFWRKSAPAATEPESAADSGPVSSANVPPASPIPPAVPAVAAPVATPEAVVVEELAELGDFSAPTQGESILEEALYTDNSTGGLAELDFIPEPEASTGGLAELDFIPEPDAPPPSVTEQAPEPRQAQAVAIEEANPEASPAQSAPSFSAAESAPQDVADSAPASIAQLRRIASLLGKKRVWIPSVSIALLAVIGSLAFMLVKTSSEKAHLQADLSAAQKALKKSDAAKLDLAVAEVPPLLVAPAPLVETPHEPKLEPAPELNPPAQALPATPPPAEAAAVKPIAEPVHATRTSSNREPVQMDCDLSDKASVAQNLKKCIEAFNQATGN